jgi:hypothetical protein
MLEQLKYMRFRTAPVHREGNEGSLTRCYWYAQMNRSIVPTGIINENILKRPCYLFT